MGLSKTLCNLKKLLLNDKFILWVITINILAVIIQEFDGMPVWLSYFDASFVAIYIAEVTVKMQTFGRKGYFSESWNRFDFIITVISIPSLFYIFDIDDAYPLNVLISLRVLRVFKFFSLIKFFPNMNSLMVGVRNAIKVSYVVICGFALLTLVVSLLTCSLFKQVAPEYFANPLQSFYSVFRIFSVEGWYEIPDLIAERSTPFIALLSKVYFIVILFGGGILGLSFVNSIFVDAMMSDNNDEMIEQIKNLEQKIDSLTDKINNIK